MEGGVARPPLARRVTRPLHEGGLLATVFLVLGALWGLVLASYTGMLLMVNNAPTWSHDPFLPPLFMAAGVAAGAASLYLIAHFTGAGDASGRRRLLRTATYALALEALLLAASVILGLRGVSPYFLGAWALLFWLVIAPFGVALPWCCCGWRSSGAAPGTARPWSAPAPAGAGCCSVCWRCSVGRPTTCRTDAGAECARRGRA